MTAYSRRDINRLRKFIDELEPHKNNYLFSIEKLTNLLYKVGFEEVLTKSGSAHIPYYHELLKNHSFFMDGIFRIARKHGKKNQMSYYDFKEYCLDAIEFVLDRMEDERLIVDDNDTEDQFSGDQNV